MCGEHVLARTCFFFLLFFFFSPQADKRWSVTHGASPPRLALRVDAHAEKAHQQRKEEAFGFTYAGYLFIYIYIVYASACARAN